MTEPGAFWASTIHMSIDRWVGGIIARNNCARRMITQSAVAALEEFDPKAAAQLSAELTTARATADQDWGIQSVKANVRK